MSNTTDHLGPEPPRCVLRSEFTINDQWHVVSLWASTRARIRVEVVGCEMSGKRPFGLVQTFHFHHGAWCLVLPEHRIDIMAVDFSTDAMLRAKCDETLAFLAMGALT